MGVTPGSLYNHFAGKQAIYQAVLERGIRPFFGLMDQLARGEQTADAADDTFKTGNKNSLSMSGFVARAFWYGDDGKHDAGGNAPGDLQPGIPVHLLGKLMLALPPEADDGLLPILLRSKLIH